MLVWGLKDEVEIEETPVVEEEVTVEKTVEKLTERNMLGRLAKQLKLNEEGKQKMFAYFEKGNSNNDKRIFRRHSFFNGRQFRREEETRPCR